ncbi:hypothetical protein [Salinactinospora qingdaonensis]|uniref:Uncharacterized protein n=1 Tax=Salinactinospora qingdaonensis TaxID=702744 RepID=A0ABP7FQ38_9ACTN
MAAGTLYGRIAKTDDFGMTRRIDILSRGTSTWSDRLRGAVQYIGNDGLCDLYEVYFDGSKIGEIEAYDHGVLCCPELDDVYDTIFNAVSHLV